LLYTALADWWPLLSAPADYAEEVAVFHHLFASHALRHLETLLELGSGGGNNASHFKHHFNLTLTDLSPVMLDVSRSLNPECEHVQGDMRTVRLGREFDAVFVHDAVTYLTTEADLRQAMATAFVHCRPGGVVLFVPDCVRETFRPETEHGGQDAPDGRGLRYLAWTWDPDPDDTTYVVDFAYLLRDPDRSVRTVGDRHINGMFPRALWIAALQETGFDVHVVVDEWGRDIFVGVKGLAPEA